MSFALRAKLSRNTLPVIGYFCERYAEAFGRDYIWKARDEDLLKALEREHGPDELRARIDAMLSFAADPPRELRPLNVRALFENFRGPLLGREPLGDQPNY